jgi:hypothetical protein
MGVRGSNGDIPSIGTAGTPDNPSHPLAGGVVRHHFRGITDAGSWVPA